MAIDAANVPKILMLVLHASDAPHLESLLHERNAHHFVLISARGTVTSDLINMLGLSGTEKYAYLCIVPKSSVEDLMMAVTERFELKKPGHGIAFVLPISAMSAILTATVTDEMCDSTNDGVAATGVASVAAGMAAGVAVKAASVAGVAASMAGAFAGAFDRASDRVDDGASELTNRRTNERNETMADENTERFELILSIVNQGFSDELMDAAREAGAQGGTVFHARGTARPEEEKFYGISLQHEKEVVAIVARKARRRAILDAVQKSCGKDTEANGVFLALPVEQSVGVG
jgi:nitrogen regulatory protein PII